MKKHTKLTALLALTIASSFVFSKEPSYTFVEVNLANYELAGSDVSNKDALGFNINGSVEIFENFYIPLSYSRYENDARSSNLFMIDDEGRGLNSFSEYDQTYNDLSIGLGYKFSIFDDSMLNFELGYFDFELDRDGVFIQQREVDGRFQTIRTTPVEDSKSLTGIYAEIQLQHFFSDKFQTNVGYKFKEDNGTSIDINDTGPTAELLYHYTDNLALTTAFESGEQNFKIGVRYTF